MSGGTNMRRSSICFLAADRGPGCLRGAARLHRPISRSCAASWSITSTTSSAISSRAMPRMRSRPRASSACCSAPPSTVPVLGPRGGHRRQRAGRALRRAREPCRLFPAGAGHDAVRRRETTSRTALPKAPGRSETRRVQGADERGAHREGAEARHDALDALLRQSQQEGAQRKIDPLKSTSTIKKMKTKTNTVKKKKKRAYNSKKQKTKKN